MDLWVFFVFFFFFSLLKRREGKHFGFPRLIKGCKSLFHHAAGEIAWCRFHGIIDQISMILCNIMIRHHITIILHKTIWIDWWVVASTIVQLLWFRYHAVAPIRRHLVVGPLFWECSPPVLGPLFFWECPHAGWRFTRRLLQTSKCQCARMLSIWWSCPTSRTFSKWSKLKHGFSWHTPKRQDGESIITWSK